MLGIAMVKQKLKTKNGFLLVKFKEVKYLYKFNKTKCQKGKNKCVIIYVELNLKY